MMKFADHFPGRPYWRSWQLAIAAIFFVISCICLYLILFPPIYAGGIHQIKNKTGHYGYIADLYGLNAYKSLFYKVPDKDDLKNGFKLFANGLELQNPNAPHDEIREKGLGRYSFFGDSLYFSTPDNAPPDEKQYTYAVKLKIKQRVYYVFIASLIIFVALYCKLKLFRIKSISIATTCMLLVFTGVSIFLIINRPVITGKISVISEREGFSYIGYMPVVDAYDSLFYYIHYGDAEHDILRLYENGKELPYSNSLHDDIAGFGAGRYSYWGNAVYFSSMDGNSESIYANSYTYDLRTSVRLYVYIVLAISIILLILLTHKFISAYARSADKFMRDHCIIYKSISGNRRFLLCVGCLLVLIVAGAYSYYAQKGLLYVTGEGTTTFGDVSNILSIVAAQTHPDSFQRDLLFSDPSNYNKYSNLNLPLVKLFLDGGDYGRAFYKLHGPVLFLSYMGFFLLGLYIFKRFFIACIFSIVCVVPVFFPAWTYWGVTIVGPQPRAIFVALFGFLILLAIKALDRPALRYVVILLSALLVYVHGPSAIGAAAGFCCAWLLSKQSWSLKRLLLHISVCALIFLAIAIFITKSLLAGPALSPAEVAVLRDFLSAAFPEECTKPFYGLFKVFYFLFVEFPVLPVAIISSAIVFWSKAHAPDKTVLKFCWLAILGIGAAGMLFFALDAVVAGLRETLPLQVNLIRCLRLVIPFCYIIIFLSVCTIFKKNIYKLQKAVAIALFAALLWCIHLNHVTYNSLLPFSMPELVLNELHIKKNGKINNWRKLSEEYNELVYQVKNISPEGSLLYIAPGKVNLSNLRYSAMRSIDFDWSVRGFVYHSKNAPLAAVYLDRYRLINSGPTGTVKDWETSKADYFICASDFPDIKELENNTDLLWSGGRFMIFRRK